MRPHVLGVAAREHIIATFGMDRFVADVVIPHFTVFGWFVFIVEAIACGCVVGRSDRHDDGASEAGGAADAVLVYGAC